jgi:8-amino-7-oxononanoate synthase
LNFLDHVRSQLADQAAAGLMRSPRTVAGRQGPTVIIDGRPVLCLCSNNYLGLAQHPRIAQAAADAAGSTGFGAAASRHISGTMELHIEAERRLARFVGAPSALLFATGFAANTGAVQALAGPDTVIFSDELNHASLIDGCRLSRARVIRFRHRDTEHLAQMLRVHRTEAPAALVITESVFSMDGDLTPLAALRQLCDEHAAGLLVDEAHALGVFGPQGRGLCRRDKVTADVLVGTLGKAFGTAGAFVAGSEDVVRLVENRARPYIFSTAPSPTLAAAAIAATALVEAGDPLRTALFAHANVLRAGLRELGYAVPEGESPVLPVIIGAADATMATSARLLEHGVFVHGIRPPTVPAGTSRLRVTAMASHSAEQITAALAAFRTIRQE